MKSLIFKCSLIILLLLCPKNVFSQDVYMDTENEVYNKRLKKYKRNWEKLIPMHTVFQYAGGMGLVSVGAGWNYGRNNQWETDVLIGYLPKYSSDSWKFTMTLKQNYIPWHIPAKKNVSIEPLECGLYFNTVFSNEFWTSEPSRYPKGYYGFSTRIRTHIFIGQRLRYEIPEKYRHFAKSITLFYEISTCDLYVVSAFTNHLDLDEYLRLSIGVKFQIF